MICYFSKGRTSMRRLLDKNLNTTLPNSAELGKLCIKKPAIVLNFRL